MVKACISEIYDLSTAVGSGTILKIHTPTGNNVKRHLAGHFLQYKKFRYVGAKVTLVPASTLPADPLQLGYEAGEPTIDPRDMVNPILWKKYHGEAMLSDAIPSEDVDAYGNGKLATDSFPGTAVDRQYYENTTEDTVYPYCLMDPSFRKAGVQAGFTTFVKPFVYNLVTDTQLAPSRNGSMSSGDITWQDDVSNPVSFDGSGNLKSPVQVQQKKAGSAYENHMVSSKVPMWTNRLTPLGPMDTVTRVWSRNFHTDTALTDNPDNTTDDMGSAAVGGSFAMQTYLPKVPMLYVMMPPAYKTLFYFRLIVKHYFQFWGFRSCFNVQSYGSASLHPVMPVMPLSLYDTMSEIAEMIQSTADGGPDSVDVEGGEILNVADGATA